MLQLKPQDSRVPIFQQLNTDVSPVVLVNVFEVASVAHFRAAFSHHEFKKALADYPSSAVASPHLFERLTVPNLCVGP